MSSSLCFCNEINVKRDQRNQQLLSRKLLFSMASISAGFNKLKAAILKEPKKAVEPSLRKAPPSLANPIQNK
ncbi:hypothetical protein JRO89_XS12G0155900 [Xanthoceras sorbifolium]|uniref:Uncharacterized protein n=1 Tax=Xanthoceras sorbifolium TaxID=99658 RepID=A0ABQ8HCS1_9ROSI|nr:hypothetical protein JRO89_XS12G0155900 [Xanthoceras sorbifolium]